MSRRLPSAFTSERAAGWGTATACGAAGSGTRATGTGGGSSSFIGEWSLFFFSSDSSSSPISSEMTLDTVSSFARSLARADFLRFGLSPAALSMVCCDAGDESGGAVTTAGDTAIISASAAGGLSTPLLTIQAHSALDGMLPLCAEDLQQRRSIRSAGVMPKCEATDWGGRGREKPYLLRAHTRLTHVFPVPAPTRTCVLRHLGTRALT